MRPPSVRTWTGCPSMPAPTAWPSVTTCQPGPSAVTRTVSPAAKYWPGLQVGLAQGRAGGDAAAERTAHGQHRVGHGRAGRRRDVDLGLAELAGVEHGAAASAVFRTVACA